MDSHIAVWHAEHVRFARLLDFLEVQMAAFHAGERPDYELMRDVVHYLHEYADRFHHPRECVAFERLVAREPGLRDTVEHLLQEHRVIATAGNALLQFLDEALDDVFIERTAVEAAAAMYLVYYRHHLATEEKEALPRAAQLLTDEDWNAVDTAVESVPDPVFGSDAGVRYRALRAQVLRAA